MHLRFEKDIKEYVLPEVMMHEIMQHKGVTQPCLIEKLQLITKILQLSFRPFKNIVNEINIITDKTIKTPFRVGA